MPTKITPLDSTARLEDRRQRRAELLAAGEITLEEVDEADRKDVLELAEPKATERASARPARRPGRPRKQPLPDPADSRPAPPGMKYMRIAMPLDLYGHIMVLGLKESRTRSEIVVDKLLKVCDVKPL